MILTYGKTSIQLTYTIEEYQEFNQTVVIFRNELATTLRNNIPKLLPGDQKYFVNLCGEFIRMLDYIDQDMTVTRVDKGIQLTFSVAKYESFDENIGLLRLDLLGFQDWYSRTGDHEKEESLEKSQDVINVFIRLLGNKTTLDS